MKAEEKAQELYPNNSTFCGGVAQIARDAFAKGARMQKPVMPSPRVHGCRRKWMTRNSLRRFQPPTNLASPTRRSR